MNHLFVVVEALAVHLLEALVDNHIPYLYHVKNLVHMIVGLVVLCKSHKGYSDNYHDVNLRFVQVKVHHDLHDLLDHVVRQRLDYWMRIYLITSYSFINLVKKLVNSGMKNLLGYLLHYSHFGVLH
jgi:hypothetical protein